MIDVTNQPHKFTGIAVMEITVHASPNTLIPHVQAIAAYVNKAGQNEL